jgi:hypothetical protein
MNPLRIEEARIRYPQSIRSLVDEEERFVAWCDHVGGRMRMPAQGKESKGLSWSGICLFVREIIG